MLFRSILILALVSFASGCKRAALAEEAEVIFGSYEQDSNPANGSEPIEWIILRANADGSRVLMSKYALDCLPYHSSYAEVSWETSEIRKWLNGYFYNEAFSEDEKNQILGMRLENKNNPSTGAKGGNDTEDSVYLLSAEEAAAYFAGRIEMACVPTEYAISKGADNGGGTCWWWLRSVGGSEFYAAYVDKDGSVIDYGDAVTYSTFAVRPVITIKAADIDWKVESGEEYFDFIEVMACPNGCIGGGGQPPASNARKAERCAAIFKEDAERELKNPQQNPALDYVYDVLLQGRAHDLLHIHYPLHGHHE